MNKEWCKKLGVKMPTLERFIIKTDDIEMFHLTPKNPDYVTGSNRLI
jgi:hypothetical protein